MPSGSIPPKGGLTNTRLTISESVARRLGRYVYVYVDPFDGSVFYVGKGTGKRALAHLDARGDSRCAVKIREIREQGGQPQIEVLVHGIQTDEEALRIEAAAIDLLQLRELTNQVRGWGTRVFGRMPLERLGAILAREKARIAEPAILIRINQLFRAGMEPIELYDATRGVWKLGKRREGARFAFAVFEGIVQEVYEIKAWFPAASTFSTRPAEELQAPDRCEFVGNLAPERIRRKYVNKSVAHYFDPPTQSPVIYLNVPER